MYMYMYVYIYIHTHTYIYIDKEFCVVGSKAKTVLYLYCSYSTARCEQCYIIRL